MPFLTAELERAGVKIWDAWHRWSHLVIRFLCPDDDSTMLLLSGSLRAAELIPGVPEMLLDGEEIVSVEHFTDRDYVGHQPRPGYQVVKCRIWFKRNETSESS